MSWMLVAGTALTVVGTGASIAGNMQAQNAVDRARKEEMARQQGYQKQGQKLLSQQLQEAQAPRQTEMLEKSARDRAAGYQQLQQNAPTAVAPVPMSANTTVETPGGEAATRASVATNAWTRLGNESGAKNLAYGDWNLARNIEQNRAAQEQAMINNKSRSSLSVFQGPELEQAKHAGDAMETVGKITTALGSVGMQLGATIPTAAAPATGAISTADGVVGTPLLDDAASLQRLNPNNPWANLRFTS